MPVLRTGSIALLLLLHLGLARAVELAEPAIRAEPAAPPRIEPDALRPSGAPTAQAIDTTVAEDGAAAGVVLADKALRASRAAYGPNDPRVTVPLVNLAHLRQRAGQVAAALADYRAAVLLAEQAGGPRDPRLSAAWYGLGYAHLQAGQADAAARAFETALQLHRINRGLYSVEQLDLLHATALALRMSGRTEDADALQQRRLDVAERVHGLGTPEVAAVYVSVGRWFRNVGRPMDAIGLHALAVEVLEKKSRDDPALIEPLIELALSVGERRRDPDEPMMPGIMRPAAALERAEKLAAARSDGTPESRAATLIGIGDAHTALGRREAALGVYARAGALLATRGLRPPFDQPAFVSLRLPAVTPVPGAGGHVLAEFRVDADGRARDIRIIETQPATLPADVAANLTRALREARLRPRIVEGQALSSTGMRFRFPVRGGSSA